MASEPRWSTTRSARPAPLHRALAVLVVAAALVTMAPAPAARAVEPVRIDVDLTRVVAATPADHIGFTATAFGVEGGTVVDSAADRRALAALGAGAVRIHLAPDGRGGVRSGAGGADQAVSADAWLDAYEAMGLRPTVILNLDRTEALAVQAHLRATGHPVRRYVLGNEMDANSRSAVSQDVYVQRFGEIAAALRATDPTLEVGGPGVACWDCLGQGFVQKLLALPPQGRLSFVDWHEYGSGAGTPARMESSWRYAAEIARLRSWLPADGSVGVQVGEFNMNWGDEPGNGTIKQSVWDAAALGTILTSGATAFQYGDKNGALGLVASGTPKASYWGLAMFTGHGRFRPFGTSAVAATSSDPAVRVFASTGGRNVVVVNTSATATASRISLRGQPDGTAQRWVLRDGRTPYRNPDKTVTGGVVDLWLPPMSVQTLVLP